MFFLPQQKKHKRSFWLGVMAAFLLYMGMPSTSWSDFDMTFPITSSTPPGPSLTLTNRQPSAATGNYLWNDDVFEVVAMGFDTTSTSTFPAAANYSVLSNDSLGAAQFRYPVVLANINTNPGSSDIINQINLNLTGTVAYPQFPHMVVREAPSWGPTWPDTTIYAPAANATDINAATGALSYADYYSPTAWVAHDDAPLTVITTGATAQHPTQLWIGIADMPANTALDDSACNCNNVSGNTMHQASPTSALGYYFAPNSPTGASGIGYNHTAAGAAAPGGLMWAMSAAWVQEFLGYNIRVPLVLGSQETAMGLFSDSTWAPVGTDPATSALGYPYQFVGINADATDAVTGFPDFWTQSLFSPYANYTTGSANYQIVTHTIVFAQDLSSRYYGYFAAARSMRILKLAAAASDPYLLFKAVADGYNLGPFQTTPIWDMECNDPERAAVEASTNVGTLPSPYTILANNNYTAQVTDLSRRIGRTNDVYDWGITWGDVQDFLSDLRTYNFGNGIPSNADWTAMTTELQTAFTAMEGKSPNVLTDGTTVGATRISFRYNWLTLLRIMKKWLPQPHAYLAKGWDMNSNEFFSGYAPTENGFYNPLETGAAVSLCSPLHLAPEVYWTNPTFTAPLPTTSFASVTVCNTSPIPVAADVKYYNDDSTTLTVRWALSPGDPTAGGYSLWHDAFKTGGITGDVATQTEDWTAMTAGGAGAVAGSTHYTGSVPVAGITGLRRLYMDADDGDGYRTVGWVNVYLKNCVVSTNTMTATNTNTQTPTATATQTSTQTPTSTRTSTNSPTPSPTSTSTMSPTSTPTQTSSPTATSTPTSTASATNSATVIPTNTSTASDTVSPTQTNTSSVTETPTPLANTATSTESLTSTATAISTNTPSSTVTYTQTATGTATSVSTNTQTASSTPTSTSTALADTATSTTTATSTATTIPTSTQTASSTPSSTSTPLADTATSTLTATVTGTNTASATSTFTPVSGGGVPNTATSTMTPTAANTWTATQTPLPGGFFVSKNVFSGGDSDPVLIHWDFTSPGDYSLNIYNSAGEHIKNIVSGTTQEPMNMTYKWDGKNKYGARCASGIYLIYATEPLQRLYARVVFIHH